MAERLLSLVYNEHRVFLELMVIEGQPIVFGTIDENCLVATSVRPLWLRAYENHIPLVFLETFE
jgi:hypothetical protein